jgi:hypothetical protein
MHFGSAEEVVAEFYRENLSWVEVPDLLMRHVNEGNVDDIISKLPQELRDWFLEFAVTHYLSDEPKIIFNPSGQEYVPLPEEAIDAVRGWFRRHPDAHAALIACSERKRRGQT